MPVPTDISDRSTWPARRALKEHGLVLIVLAVLTLLPRIYLLWRTGAGIESDEAIVGLMAKHIAEGAEWPIFYYGQPYLGTIEPLTVALVFKLFGISNWALKAVPTGYSVVFVWLVYALALRFVDRRTAFAAAVLPALGPSGFVIWSVKARGGFIELLVIGTAALILAVDLLRRDELRSAPIFLLGVLVGLGWWTNNQIVFYMLPIGAVYGVELLRRRGLVGSVPAVVSGSVGFFIGGAPFWYANLFTRPRLASFTVLSKRATPAEALEHFRGFWAEALPMIMGARRFWAPTDVLPGAMWVLYAIYGVVLGLALWAWVKPGLLFGSRSSERPALSMLILLFVFMPVVFSLSGFGSLTQEPRYLMPLYSILSVLVAVASVALRSLFGGPGRIAGTLLWLVILGAQLASNYVGGLAVAGQPFVYDRDRVLADHSELYSWLTKHRYSHVKTNYWIGYRLAFETKEQITFSIYRGPQSRRISWYEQLSPEEEPFLPYVLVPLEARVVARALSERGLVFRTSKVGGYIILDDVHPVSRPGPELTLQPEQIAVTSRPEWRDRLVDADQGSRWGSGKPQSPGMMIETDLAQPTLLAAVRLDYGFWPQDAAPELLIEGLQVDGRWCAIFDSRGTEALVEVGRTLQVFIEPREFTKLRIVELGSDPIFDWSVAELALFGPAEKEE